MNAEDSSQLSDRLHHAEELNRIDDPSLSPWYLKVSFQLFDAKGKPAEQGTIEEWWHSPSSYKTVYTSPSYTATEIETPDGLYRTKLVLIRPDQHIAWHGDNVADPMAVIDRVRGAQAPRRYP